MQKLSKVIADGARQFLVTEYKYLAAFVTIVAIILVILFSTSDKRVDDNDGIRVAGCFIVGAILSAWAGWQGMAVATDANAKTTHAADKEGLNAALQVAFSGGAVMGFTTVGFGLFGVAVMLLLMMQGRGDATDAMSYGYAAKNLAGFGFGASAIALFARVAGGIYTKAADVGADLVGKVESDFPEDSFYNPATIADNVGDNVGDLAGMGADLFESFVGSIVAAGTLGMTAHTNGKGDMRRAALPFWIAGFGVVASLIGFFLVSTNATMKEPEDLDDPNISADERKRRFDAHKAARDKLQHDLLIALHKGIYASGLIILDRKSVV